MVLLARKCGWLYNSMCSIELRQCPVIEHNGEHARRGKKRYFIKRRYLSTNDAYFLSAGSYFEGSKSRYFPDGTDLTSVTAFMDFFSLW